MQGLSIIIFWPQADSEYTYYYRKWLYKAVARVIGDSSEVCAKFYRPFSVNLLYSQVETCCEVLDPTALSPQ